MSTVITRSHADKKVSIMIVDDSLTNIQILGSRLRSEGVEIIVATNGKAALTTLRSVKPDLILLDIMMPEMDGFEVCEKLKADPHLKDIPVIFLTARINSEDIVRAFELGAIDYILKPFNSSELIARVNAQLQLKFYREEIEEKNGVLENLNKKLVELNDEKNEFLGIAAHDLKNPIYGISMIGRALKDSENLSKNDIEDFSNDIVSSSEKMLELIRNLLDINAIERGGINKRNEIFDLNETMDILVDTYKERAQQKKINLIYETKPFQTLINNDKRIVNQILDNLISNAVKYSNFEKAIYIRLNYTEINAIIEIEDQGPGLSEDDQKKLFGKFARLTPQPTGNELSTGLGLSIVKRLVECLEGEVKCESLVGVGSTFILSLPINMKKA